MKQIRIHDWEPGLHGLGIEYNFDGYDWEMPANDFVIACNRVLDKARGWFHQCGSLKVDGQFVGYQFFEMLGCHDVDVLFEQAEKVATAIGAELVI